METFRSWPTCRPETSRHLFISPICQTNGRPVSAWTTTTQSAQYETIKARTLYLSGNVDLPFAPEMGVGAPHWFTPLKHSDSLFCAMTALAHGLRGLNLYMGGRPRSLVRRADRQRRPNNQPSCRLGEALRSALKRSSFHRLQRKPRVALVIPREYLRLSHVTQRFGPLNASFMQMAGLDPFVGCDVQFLWLCATDPKALCGHLSLRLHIRSTTLTSPTITSTAKMTRSGSRDTPCVLHPTYEFMSAARIRFYASKAKSGIKKYFSDRSSLTLDDVMQPLTRTTAIKRSVHQFSR